MTSSLSSLLFAQPSSSSSSSPHSTSTLFPMPSFSSTNNWVTQFDFPTALAFASVHKINQSRPAILGVNGKRKTAQHDLLRPTEKPAPLDFSADDAHAAHPFLKKLKAAHPEDGKTEREDESEVKNNSEYTSKEQLAHRFLPEDIHSELPHNLSKAPYTISKDVDDSDVCALTIQMNELATEGHSDSAIHHPQTCLKISFNRRGGHDHQGFR